MKSTIQARWREGREPGPPARAERDALDGPAEAPVDPPVDHFKCYKAKISKGAGAGQLDTLREDVLCVPSALVAGEKS